MKSTRLNPLKIIKRLSSLYSGGSKGSGKYVALSPHVEFDASSVKEKQENFRLRQVSINLAELSTLWDEYSRMREKRQALEDKRALISEKVNDVKKQGGNKQEMDRLKISGKLIRDDLKALMSAFRLIEENVSLKVLGLPNDLDPRVSEGEQVIKTFLKPPPKGLHHLEAGQKFIEYFSPTTYFLKDSAALFELSALSYFNDVFTEGGFVPFSCPDFSRDVIMSGFGVDERLLSMPLEPHHEEEGLNLTGGASAFAFCSFHAKSIVDSASLPVKYVSRGRQYSTQSSDDGLYGVWQRSSSQVFIASSHDTIVDHFDSTVNLLSGAYEALGLPFRLVYSPAQSLLPSEMIRASLQLFSPHKQKFVEAANISLYGSYLSKRLRMYYSDKDCLKFLSSLSGTILNVPVLLAVLLEHGVERNIPEPIAKYMGVNRLPY